MIIFSQTLALKVFVRQHFVYLFYITCVSPLKKYNRLLTNDREKKIEATERQAFATRNQKKKVSDKICMVAAPLKKTKRKNNNKHNYKTGYVRISMC